ncbi:22594_t:CDS:1 [Cetraspora pellucida]|uniref:22594_t:CDS:1 n=1 Tax=Cetraspora pellucida TaxID=1433469 RepID=A0A9N9FB43_9GLOM|nr:22594_t:CDS:1 [Cetraspora pellucida]
MADPDRDLEMQRTEGIPSRIYGYYMCCRSVLIDIFSYLYNKVTAKRVDENKTLIDDLSQQVVKLQKEIELLKQKNNSLKDEASNYQVALSKMTSYRLADDDQNNSVYLTEDINKLYDKVSKFVTNLKKGVSIHESEVSELMKQYKCNTEVASENLDIRLVKEVLKRLVIETIINMVNAYFKFDKSDKFHLEKDIINPLSPLLNNFYKLSNERSGSSDIIKAIPTKVRQQIYMVLGNLAFSDVTCEDGILEHPFISNSKKQLINTMNQYRTINDVSKRREIENQASALIRDVISIFYFRRHIQEPIVDYMWIENNKPFDPLFMDGIWDDNDVSDSVVQFCSFPLFGSELGDLNKMQVYTRARVITQD